MEVIGNALPVLKCIMEKCDDQDTLVDAMWALSYLSDGSDERIQTVVDQGVVPTLVDKLLSGVSQVITPALRTLGNIVSGNERQTQATIDANVLPALVQLLSHDKKNIRKESCWMLSNIAAGSLQQMTLLFVVPELLPRILSQLSSSTEWEVRKEAVWVISNIATTGQKPHVVQLVEYGVIRHLSELLDVQDSKVLKLVMEIIEIVLKLEKENPNCNYCQLFDEAGGLSALEILQEHENSEIYEGAVRIIETFFGTEDEEEESENFLLQQESNAYSFGFQTSGKASVDFNKSFIDGFSSSAPAVGQFQFSF